MHYKKYIVLLGMFVLLVTGTVKVYADNGGDHSEGSRGEDQQQLIVPGQTLPSSTIEDNNNQKNDTASSNCPSGLDNRGQLISKFTRSLHKGEHNDDISKLQKILIGKGLLTAINTPTGFFGQMTEEAVNKLQSEYGVVGGDGAVVGPQTEDVLDSLETKMEDAHPCDNQGENNQNNQPTHASCSYGDLFNSETGAACPVPAPVTVCKPNDLFNSQTGAACPVAAAVQAKIISFNSTTPAVTGIIGDNTISLVESTGTSLTNLPITIALSAGATVVPAAGNHTFTAGVPQTYTVTAQDGTTTKAYAVTVTVQ